MSTPARRRTSKRSYLTTANYYRLAYQLAAQYANWLLEFLAAQDSYEAYERPLVSVQSDWPGITAAARLAHEARLTIRWFSYRESRRRLWRRKSTTLSPKEERLRRFLIGTVEPSAELVLAGMFLLTDRVQLAEDIAAPIQEAADRGELSYRALYNLACYEASRGEFRYDDEDQFNLALEHLRQALRGARGRFRAELVRWSHTDPSLAPLRDHERYGPRFAALLQRFEATEVLATTVADGAPRPETEDVNGATSPE